MLGRASTWKSLPNQMCGSVKAGSLWWPLTGYARRWTTNKQNSSANFKTLILSVFNCRISPKCGFQPKYKNNSGTFTDCFLYYQLFTYYNMFLGVSQNYRTVAIQWWLQDEWENLQTHKCNFVQRCGAVLDCLFVAFLPLSQHFSSLKFSSADKPIPHWFNLFFIYGCLSNLILTSYI